MAFVIRCTLFVLRIAMPLRISIERLKFVESPCLLMFIWAIFLSLARRVFYFDRPSLPFCLTRSPPALLYSEALSWSSDSFPSPSLPEKSNLAFFFSLSESLSESSIMSGFWSLALSPTSSPSSSSTSSSADSECSWSRLSEANLLSLKKTPVFCR